MKFKFLRRLRPQQSSESITPGNSESKISMVILNPSSISSAHTPTFCALQKNNRKQDGRELRDIPDNTEVTETNLPENLTSVSQLSAPVRLPKLLPPDDIEAKVFSDSLEGVVYYAEDEINHAGIQSFLTRAERRGYKPQATPLTEVSRLRALVKGSGSGKDSDEIRRAVNVIEEAASRKASDIHIYIGLGGHTEVKFRIHGMIVRYREWTTREGEEMASTIYHSMADVSDPTYNPRISQDGRISSREYLPDSLHGVRVATSRTDFGSMMVLRLLENDALKGSLDTFGYHRHHVEHFEEMCSHTSGIVLVTGPTGSGKSSTLKCCLENIYRQHQGQIHIISVEDPPEYPIKGVNQTQVTNASTAKERREAFNKQIRAAMRLDPDILMVGEIRDRPSAELAVEGALTGHQVWTTLHVNSAFETIDRLLQLGVEPNVLCNASVINGVCFQRLIQVLCDHCKKPYALEKHQLTQSDRNLLEACVPDTDHVFIRTKSNCGSCGGIGVKGRQAAAEVLLGDSPILKLIVSGRRDEAHTLWKEDPKTVTLQQHVTLLVYQGKVDPRDALSVAMSFDDIHSLIKQELSGVET